MWDREYLIKVFLSCSSIKTIIKFLINTLEFVKLQTFIENEQKYTWDQKSSIWVVGLECWKTIDIFGINAVQFI